MWESQLIRSNVNFCVLRPALGRNVAGRPFKPREYLRFSGVSATNTQTSHLQCKFERRKSPTFRKLSRTFQLNEVLLKCFGHFTVWYLMLIVSKLGKASENKDCISVMVFGDNLSDLLDRTTCL